VTNSKSREETQQEGKPNVLRKVWQEDQEEGYKEEACQEEGGGKEEARQEEGSDKEEACQEEAGQEESH
jgi:hypothetical protein